jgi:hypothetical protein
LPQSTFDNLTVFFTPMRWAALGLFILALALSVWPEVQLWIGFKDNPVAVGSSVTPVVLPADPSEGREVTMVITPVQSAAIPTMDAKNQMPNASEVNNGR